MNVARNLALVVALPGLLVGPRLAAAEETRAEVAEHEPHPRAFVSTSMFVLANLLPNPPHFYQLDAGYRATARDTLIVEAITWTYYAPIGIPYGPAYEDPAYNYEGFVRDMGVGVAYQRFWWRGLFTTVHATPLRQTYHEGGERVGAGFQLFVAGRVGYHLDLWKQRVFVEPSLACTAWPIRTPPPRSFARRDASWPRYFLAEPGLNVGVHL